jgi:hypothetical protein
MRLPDLRTLPSSIWATCSLSAADSRSVILPLNENDEVRDATRRFGRRVRTFRSSSVRPSQKCSWSFSALMSWKGSTAIDARLAASPLLSARGIVAVRRSSPKRGGGRCTGTRNPALVALIRRVVHVPEWATTEGCSGSPYIPKSYIDGRPGERRIMGLGGAVWLFHHGDTSAFARTRSAAGRIDALTRHASLPTLHRTRR